MSNKKSCFYKISEAFNAPPVRYRWRVIGFLFLISGPGSSFSQTINTNHDAGVESIFSQGVGARALGLGGAYTAVANDASVIYWNPAGIDLLNKKTASIFYSNLPAGGQFSFLGYAHTTVNLGAFAFAALRVGTNDIERTDLNQILGTGSYSQTQFLFSYGKQLPYNLAIGASIKLEQQNWGNFEETGAGRGVGADMGLLYKPDFSTGILQNFSLGVTIKNAIPPIIGAGLDDEATPRMFKLGWAKSIFIGNDQSTLSFLGDIAQGERNKNYKIHFGTEYSFQGRAMLRAGFNNNELVFGAGTVVDKFRLDYSFGRYGSAPEIPSSHRFSVTIEIGRTKEESIRLAEIQRADEIADSVRIRSIIERKTDLQEHIEAGNALYTKKEFFLALIRFNQAKMLEPGDRTVNNMVARCKQKIEEERLKREEETFQQRLSEVNKQQQKSFVDGKIQKAESYFANRQWEEAIAEWELALKSDPDNASIKEYISETKTLIQKEFKDTINDAQRLAVRQKYVDAIGKLQKIQNSSQLDEQTRNQIGRDILLWRNRVSMEDAYNKGLRDYNDRNYVEALRNFDQALALSPQNKTYKKWRDRADSWANVKDEPFATDYIRNQYKKASLLSYKKEYKLAKEILESIYPLQRYNRDILQSLDDVENASRNLSK